MPAVVGSVKGPTLKDKPVGPVDPLGGPATLWAANLLPSIGTEPLEAGVTGFAVIGEKRHIFLPGYSSPLSAREKCSLPPMML